MQHYDVLIVGGGHGGAQAAVALRQNGFEGTLAIVGEEPDPPYERPALSKDYLGSEKPFERLLIRPAAFWRDRSIDMLLGRRVVAVRPEAHEAAIDDGSTINYGSMIWATGGAPRRLECEGNALTGVYSVRTRNDVDRIVAALNDVSRVVIVGGGYIGLEAAAVLTKLCKYVFVLEALPRVLARVAGEPLSRFYEAEHRSHGVDIRLNAVVECIEGAHGKVCGVRLADGDVLPCDMVIIGIGIVPAIEPLAAAGAAHGNGVDVDSHCRTSLPDIFAIGDCAAHRNSFAGGARIRLESVQNANDQATTAAKAIAGIDQPYRSIPWFWSNQYDLRLQTVGLSTGYDSLVVRGQMASRSFSLVYLKEGRVIAVDSVNATRDFVQARALVARGARIAPDILADPAHELKELADGVSQ